MDFLAISKYGNSAEDYLISMVILVVSVFASRWAYSILRKTVCEWVCNHAVTSLETNFWLECVLVNCTNHL